MRLRAQHTTSAGLAAAVDPRVRLLGAMTLLALVVSSSGSSFPWLVAAICVPATLLNGMRLRTLILRLLHPLFICAVILLLKGLSGGATAVSPDHSGVFYANGLHSGLLITARIMGAVSVAILLGQIMGFTETMAALSWLRVPRSLVEVALFAWRSLFMLYDDAGVVYSAQKNRLGYCGTMRSLRSFGTMAGMLTIKAFDSSHAMTVAMSQRGYDGSLPLLSGTRPSRSQLGGLALFIAVAAAAWKLQNLP